MKTLDLNLASRPFRNNTLLWLAYGFAAVLLLNFAVRNVRAYRAHTKSLVSLRAQVASIDKDLDDLRRREASAVRDIERYDLKSMTVQAGKANDVIRWKTFSFTRLFNILESLLPGNVKMTSVQPVFRANASQVEPTAGGEHSERGLPVHVQGVARDLRAFFELESALLSDPHFDRIEPDRIVTVEGTKETGFELRFVYDPEAEPEPAAAPSPSAESPEQEVPLPEEGGGAAVETAEVERAGAPRGATEDVR